MSAPSCDNAWEGPSCASSRGSPDRVSRARPQGGHTRVCAQPGTAGNAHGTSKLPAGAAAGPKPARRQPALQTTQGHRLTQAPRAAMAGPRAHVPRMATLNFSHLSVPPSPAQQSVHMTHSSILLGQQRAQWEGDGSPHFKERRGSARGKHRSSPDRASAARNLDGHTSLFTQHRTAGPTQDTSGLLAGAAAGLKVMTRQPALQTTPGLARASYKSSPDRW